MLKHYFKLQFKLLYRVIQDAGVSPLFVLALSPLLFIGILEFLFVQTEYASYVIGALSISLVTKLSDHNRNEFLQHTFSTQDYRLIRLIENTLITLPFFLFLLFKTVYSLAFILFTLNALLSFWNNRSTFNTTIPTPFKSKSFEFIIGFRQSFILYLLPYFFLLKSAQEQNMNLGIFAFVIQSLLILQHYSKPESQYIVWNYAFNPKQFLLHKLKLAWINTTLINLSIILVLVIFYSTHWPLVIGFHFISLVYISYLILLKYHAFPREMNIPQGIMLLVTLLFPPIILLALPYQFIESQKRLKAILK